MSAPITSKSITIKAPTKLVWDLIYDVSARPVWDDSIKSIELFHVMQIGAKGKIFPDLGPANDFTITKIDSLKCLKLTSPLMWITMEFSHILTQRNDATEVTFDMQCVGIQAEFVANIFRSNFSSYLDKALLGLKKVAERSAVAKH